MITLSYICKSSRISAARVGVQQSLSFKPSKLDPFDYEEKKVNAISWGGDSRKTTVFSEHRQASVTAGAIDDSDLEQWKEFIESVRRGEAFDFDASGHRGVNENVVVFIPDSKHKIGRESDLAKYKVSFVARIVVDN